MDTEDFDDSKMSDNENPKSFLLAENLYHFSQPGERLSQTRGRSRTRELIGYRISCRIIWKSLVGCL